MHRRTRLLTAILFAFALALRLWVPAGWMPTPGAHSLAIMPCPAADPAPMMDMGHGSSEHRHASGDCFSPLLAGIALPPPPAAIAAPSLQGPAARPLLPAVALTRASPDPRPHSTGPPQLA